MGYTPTEALSLLWMLPWFNAEVLPVFPRQEGGNWQALLTCLAGVAVRPAGGAETQTALRALNRLRQLHLCFIQLAHRLARGRRAPGPTRIQEHLCKEKQTACLKWWPIWSDLQLLHTSTTIRCKSFMNVSKFKSWCWTHDRKLCS